MNLLIKHGIGGLILLGGLLSLSVVHAELDCGEDYAIRSGDTLGSIAQRAYGTIDRWNYLWHVNRDTLGQNPHLIRPGTRIRLPCPGGEPERISDPQEGNEDGDLTLLVGYYPPFTARDLPQGGMITHLLAEALDRAGESFRVVRINDYRAHLEVLLRERHFDASVPWFDPDCSDPRMRAAHPVRCEYRFSEPLMETLILLWKRSNDPFRFTDDDDIVGKRVCRPAGWFLHDLDAENRRWVSNNRITLIQPDSLRECFRMLLLGEVDLVSDNEFSGLQEAADLGIGDRVESLANPIATGTLHVLVHRSHPRASLILNTINRSIEELREDRRYHDLIAEHLDLFWAHLDTL